MKKNNLKVIKLESKSKNTIKRTVFIKDFVVNEIIGIHKHEKINKQKIIFNLIIGVDQNITPNEKNLKSIINYEKITIKLEKLVKSKKYNFLESLAEDSIVEIFKDKRIKSIKIKIEKPEAIKAAGAVGIEVYKNRNDHERS